MRKNKSRYIRSFTFLSLLFMIYNITAAAGEESGDGWLRFALQGTSFGPLYGASSELEPGEGIYRSRYGPHNAMDQDPATAWVEGVPGPGMGESYWLGLEHYPEALGFINGYAKNMDLFEKNFRVKSLNVQVFAAVNLTLFAGQWETYYDARPISEVITVELADMIKPQQVRLPFDPAELSLKMQEFKNSNEIRTMNFPQAKEIGFEINPDEEKNFIYIIRLEINSVYPGSKWEDTCIAELWPDYGQTADVFLCKESKILSIVDSQGRHIPVFYDFDYVLTLLDISRDNKWALVIKEPAYPGSGRVSSEYAIIHLPTGRELTANILGPDSSRLLPYAFSFENRVTYIEYENLETGKEGRAECVLYF